MLSFPEVDDLTADVRRVFEELDRRIGTTCPPGLSNLYAPALDVIETATSVEIHVDLPGVAADRMRVFFKEGAIVIAGEKRPAEPCGPEGAAFHLVERSFGRFARVVRVGVALDGARAEAVLEAGELRITVPRLEERRGHEIPILVKEPQGTVR